MCCALASLFTEVGRVEGANGQSSTQVLEVLCSCGGGGPRETELKAMLDSGPNKPSGRQSARQTLEDELSSARGSRWAAAISRPPCESHTWLGSSRSISSSPNASTAARAARDDEIVVPELDAPRHCGSDPRGDLENELVDTKTVCHEFCYVLAGNVVILQAVARCEGSGMLVARQGRRLKAGRARLTVRDARGETGPPAQSRERATY